MLQMTVNDQYLQITYACARIVRLSCLHVQFEVHCMSACHEQCWDIHVQCCNLQHLAIQPTTTHHLSLSKSDPRYTANLAQAYVHYVIAAC